MTPDFDVVIASDLRFSGGTSASIAEEVVAQAGAGYRTGLVHVPGPVVSTERTFNPRISRCLVHGLADLITPEQRATARLLVLRHPAVFADPAAAMPAIATERRVMIVNQPSADATAAVPFYDPDEVRAAVADRFGGDETWIPIGPLVRRAMKTRHPNLPMAERDWANVLDPAQWSVERPPPAGRRPVIGRHSRPQFRKWPAKARDLLAAYPDDPRYPVEVLGGVGGARRVLRRRLRRVPRSWTVYGFNEMPVRDFLARIDFFVYFHHPGWIEAFGRAPLEAMASGAVCILPRHFEEVFGPAALYGEPNDVRRLVDHVWSETEAFEGQARRAREHVAEQFSHRTHVNRVRDLIGDPSGEPRTVSAVPSTGPHGGSETVLFVTTNGSGMGHLTRGLAMARRASDGIRPVFLSLSQAVSAVRDMGYLCEYYPSWKYWGVTTAMWHPRFAARLDAVVSTYRPSAVVFDGTVPYPGVTAAADAHPEIQWVWARRAMWKPGEGVRERIERGRFFDAVIEPGEVAASADRGLTTEYRREARLVDPVLLLDPDEALDRTAAREALGLNDAMPTALVTLGAGNINDLTATVRTSVSTLTDAGFRVVVTSPAIAESDVGASGGVTSVRVHPLARYLNAFDAAVSAAGYNSFHELLAAGIPTIFVPNEATALDDQLARARFADEHGLAICVREVDADAGLPDAVDRLGDPAEREVIAKRAAASIERNGAPEAMRAVEGLVREA